MSFLLVFSRPAFFVAVQSQTPSAVRPGAGSCARMEYAPRLCFSSGLPGSLQAAKADWPVAFLIFLFLFLSLILYFLFSIFCFLFPVLYLPLCISYLFLMFHLLVHKSIF
jgi:hypothetical protein